MIDVLVGVGILICGIALGILFGKIMFYKVRDNVINFPVQSTEVMTPFVPDIGRAKSYRIAKKNGENPTGV